MTKNKLPAQIAAIGLTAAIIAMLCTIAVLNIRPQRPSVVITTQNVPYRVERIDSTRIYVSYNMQDIYSLSSNH